MHTIALLGGSFDPVHRAHLALADALASALRLDELRFLPAGRPWQKEGVLASAAARLAMLELALVDHVAPHGRYLIDARELQRDGTTYTIDTLIELRQEVGADVSLIFLIGADQLVHLDDWKRWTELWDYAHLAVAARPGFALDALPDAVRVPWSLRRSDAAGLRATPSGKSFTLCGLAMDVSATAIREYLEVDDQAAQSALARLVPRAVLDYIRLNHLYRS